MNNFFDMFRISTNSSHSSTRFLMDSGRLSTVSSNVTMNDILNNRSKEAGSLLFKAARENNIELLKKLIGEDVDPSIKGALGENVLHVAALYNNRQAAVTLLDAYPFLLNKPMESEMYQGETALHIAVVNQNVSMVKELLARKADIENACAVGKFFAPGKSRNFYYGEYVLSFAVCIGNEKIIKLLVESGAPLHSRDKQGNTALHMLALHPNRVMACKIYDFMISLIPCEIILRLEKIENNCGFTPLKLAASEGNLKMFEYFMEKRKKPYCVFGPVSSSLYDLTGIDSYDDKQSVLDIICSSKKNDARILLELTPVKELMHYKWKKYGSKFFLLWTFLYVSYTVLLTICCLHRPLKPADSPLDQITIKVSKTLREAYATRMDFLRLAGEIIVVLGAFFIIALEIPRIYRRGLAHLFGTTITGGPFHTIMTLCACFIVIAMILRIFSLDGESVVLPLALVCAWCNVIYFARGSSHLGPLCIMIQKMILGDLLRFCMILILVVIGFSAAFDVHFQALNTTLCPIFRDFPFTLFTVFQLMMGLTDLPGPPAVKFPDFVIILYMVYMFFAFILLLNLLIALMGDTHFRVTGKRKSLWKAQIATTTLLMERNIPRWLWPRSGTPGDVLGLEEGKWYLRVEEKNENFRSGNREMEESDGDPSVANAWNLLHSNMTTNLRKKVLISGS
ncbi:transient receptor potential cation channel subfamily V member 6-like isoform X1 [Pleurodeles waltl]|uniref:transient receptor potential cation channel subfamily V member 6-like isoform X1 n=2 Tax=Pleurodeles waltl TaxID=8319 RepID=UPI0037094286